MHNKKNVTFKKSATENLYVTIQRPLNLQDMLNIKETLKDFPLTTIQNQSFKINNCFENKSLNKFIILNTKAQNQNYTEFLSNNCLIRLSNDELNAQIKLHPQANQQNVLNDLSKIGITTGIILDDLQKNLSQKQQFFTIAQGTPPQEHIPRKFQLEYPTTRPLPPLSKQGDKVVYLDPTFENRVLKNQVIAAFTNEVLGEIGTTVTGFHLPTTIHTNETITIGQNVKIEGNQIISTTDGMVRYSSDCIEVVPTLIIKEPILRQEINFAGTIIIENSVKLSTIHAEEDLIIYGPAEENTLSCGGHLYLLSGIIGKKSQTTSQYDTFCSYAYDASLTSNLGNIHLANETINSKLKANQAIYGGNLMLGGLAEAGTFIVTNHAGGANSEKKTRLFITIDPQNKPLDLANIQNKLQNLEHKYKTKNKQLKNIEAFYHNKKDLMKFSTYHQLASQIFEIQNEIKENLLHLEHIQNKFSSYPLFSITIKKHIWDKVMITINNQTLPENLFNNGPTQFVYGLYGITKRQYLER